MSPEHWMAAYFLGAAATLAIVGLIVGLMGKGMNHGEGCYPFVAAILWPFFLPLIIGLSVRKLLKKMKAREG